MIRYTLTVLIALSVLLNAIIGGLAYEPLSSAARRRAKNGKPALNNTIDFLLGDGHCVIAHAHYLLSISKRQKRN